MEQTLVLSIFKLGGIIGLYIGMFLITLIIYILLAIYFAKRSKNFQKYIIETKQSQKYNEWLIQLEKKKQELR